MGGPRANYILVEDGVLYGYADKYGGQSIPEILLQGEREFLSWLRSVAEKRPFLHDSESCEGAILVNADSREVIAGFSRWDAPHLESDPFESLRDYQTFHHFEDLQLAYLKLFSRLWADWKLRFAEVPSFGVAGCVRTTFSEVKPLQTKRRKVLRNAPTPQEGFKSLLFQLLTPQQLIRLNL